MQMPRKIMSLGYFCFEGTISLVVLDEENIFVPYILFYIQLLLFIPFLLHLAKVFHQQTKSL